MKGHLSKGHDYWLRAPLCGYINKPSFSIVIILLFILIHYIYICPYGFDYYIPYILDYLCMTTLFVSFGIRDKFDPGCWTLSIQTLFNQVFDQPTFSEFLWFFKFFEHNPDFGH
jgi:hypothetical protein